ncbi:MAG: hypothetical protein WC710_14260 [Gallionella sp.]|jgi:hypothetical protein
MSLTLEVYSSGSTLLLPDDYRDVTGISYDCFYPGGLFGTASFFIPRPPARLGLILPGMRVKICSGNVTVWEGYVSSRALNTDETTSGVLYTCIGAWGYILDGTLINKPWAETSIASDIWKEVTSAFNVADVSLNNLADVDRKNRLHFMPTSTRDAAGAEVGWASNEYYRITYTAPVGQTVKRVTYNYDLNEGAQQWALGLFNTVTSAAEAEYTTTSATAADVTLGTPSRGLWLYLLSYAAQIPPTDDSVYAQVSDVTVYTETGAIDSTEIAKDILPFVTACSSSEAGIGSNTLPLVPFVADNISAAAALMQAAGYGDSSYNAWAFCIKESDLSPDDKPILYYAQQPALTEAEYYIRLDDANLQAPISLVQDTAEVRNWITVRYRDVEDNEVVLSPDDDANLKDTTSIATYGTRAEEIQLDTTSTTLATSYGRRFLAARKDPQWTIQGGLTVQGYIRNATGGNVPAANIRPGERVRIENFIEDISGTGLTFLITGTAYIDSTQTNMLEIGRPNNLDVWLARVTGGLRRGAGGNSETRFG